MQLQTCLKTEQVLVEMWADSFLPAVLQSSSFVLNHYQCIFKVCLYIYIRKFSMQMLLKSHGMPWTYIHSSNTTKIYHIIIGKHNIWGEERGKDGAILCYKNWCKEQQNNVSVMKPHLGGAEIRVFLLTTSGSYAETQSSSGKVRIYWHNFCF